MPVKGHLSASFEGTCRLGVKSFKENGRDLSKGSDKFLLNVPIGFLERALG